MISRGMSVSVFVKQARLAQTRPPLSQTRIAFSLSSSLARLTFEDRPKYIRPSTATRKDVGLNESEIGLLR